MAGYGFMNRHLGIASIPVLRDPSEVWKARGVGFVHGITKKLIQSKEATSANSR